MPHIQKFYKLIICIKDASLLLFQMSTNAQPLLMTAIQMRLVLTQKVHSLVAATLDIPGMANNAWVCSFCAVNDNTQIYSSRFKFAFFAIDTNQGLSRCDFNLKSSGNYFGLSIWLTNLWFFVAAMPSKGISWGFYEAANINCFSPRYHKVLLIRSSLRLSIVFGRVLRSLQCKSVHIYEPNSGLGT